jgi:RNA polymerase sigma-70 factor, ECF subfamily
VERLMTRATSFDPSGGRDVVVPLQPAAAATLVDVETIYRRYYRDVYRYVLGLTRTPDEADDITAEAFERALRAGRSAALRERPLPWLLLTARRVATDRWRRARRLAELVTRIASRPPGDAMERRSEFWIWFDALARVLTDRQREVLLLRYQRDLTDADIASIMGLSESGVRSLVGRALAVLRGHPELLP